MAEYLLDVRPGGDGYTVKTLQGVDLVFNATLPAELQDINYDLTISDINGTEKISITSADSEITETDGAFKATVEYSDMLASAMTAGEYKFVARYWDTDADHKLALFHGLLIVDWGI